MLNFCPDCYEIDGLKESYPFLDNLEKDGSPVYEIYSVDPWDLNMFYPSEDSILAMTNLETKEIYLRRDLRDKTAYLHILKFNNDGFVTEEEIHPVDAHTFTAYHEAEHQDRQIKGKTQDESEVNMGAFEKYKKNYPSYIV